MSKFKAEVIADSSGKWAGNMLEFDTFDEAREYVKGLAYRWTLVTSARVVEFEGEEVIREEVVW